MRELVVREESWPIAGRFTISRGSRTGVRVVVAELRDERAAGRGECVPYARYGESVGGVLEAIASVRSEVEQGLTRDALRRVLPPGAARNALDCAMWDLEAKRSGRRVWELAGLPAPEPLVTAYTISLDTPKAMATAARAASQRPLLKLKLGARDAVDRVAAVRAALPATRLIVDANEAWSPEQLRAWGPRLAELGVELVEQPLPAAEDRALEGIECPVPLCADESCRGAATLELLRDRYDVVNIKLDKTGGLTEAAELAKAARSAGLDIMVGCMVATSLAMAPATLLGTLARFVDLDGPLLLARDREPGLRYDESLLYPSPPALCG